MTLTVPVAALESTPGTQWNQEHDLDWNPYCSDTVDLGPHLGEVVRRRDAVAAGTAVQMARVTKKSSTIAASPEFVAGLNEDGALRLARWHATKKSAPNERGLQNIRSRTRRYWYQVTERQQRIFDLLMSGVPVQTVKAMLPVITSQAGVTDAGVTDKGLEGVTTYLPSPKTVDDSGVGGGGLVVLQQHGPEAPRQAAQQARTPSSKRKKTSAVKHPFPRPRGPFYDFEGAVYAWVVSETLRDLRAAQKAEEDMPSPGNLRLARLEDVYEKAADYIENFDSNNPRPSVPKRMFAQWVTGEWIERRVPSAVEFAFTEFDPRRLVKEREAGSKGGSVGKRGPSITLEMVESVAHLSVPDAARALGCSERTVQRRRNAPKKI